MSNNKNNSQQQPKHNQETLLRIDKEKEFFKKSRNEVQKHWKKILSEETLDTLKNTDLVSLQNHCEKEIKRRDELIHKVLLVAFDHAEDQYRVSVASHLRTIDGMIDMYDAVLCTMERDFHEKLDVLKVDYEREKKVMAAKFEGDKCRILNEVKSIDVEEKRLLDEHNREQQQAIEEIKNKNLEDVNSLRFVLDTRIEDLDEQFEISKNEYLQKTEVQSETLQKQIEKDREMSKELISLQHQISKLCASTKRLKSVARRNSSQQIERNRRLLERKNEVISRYMATKAKIEDLRLSQHGKLKGLTKQANAWKSTLEKEYNLIQRILKLIHLTKKMETEEERKHGQASETSDMEGIFDSESIWKRYNNVLIGLHSLKEEEDQLLRKNCELKGKLLKCQDGVTVNDRVMRSRNPLIVVNGKT